MSGVDVATHPMAVLALAASCLRRGVIPVRGSTTPLAEGGWAPHSQLSPQRLGSHKAPHPASPPLRRKQAKPPASSR